MRITFEENVNSLFKFFDNSSVRTAALAEVQVTTLNNYFFSISVLLCFNNFLIIGNPKENNKSFTF